ncbi:MazG nucleotide pyrophosphohydrolase domain-containing protein [Geosporobacter subterraneus DSM 17957]|uniref:MazG nucleotide pyrophosphohydrolase domain-containing protein n=1 Tax=Geosporobacter subterraneus DSM 17957 TaxID=1121919 RepID=A0A1M6C6W6_9FIRM|nr:MazG nucleotide pyrophosphohydrolase domain-containing protein [Geosporobacter subterraneus]SHI56797.1 MazG nucleotide pyrophosphohydrolase domain-containing protein [Geosporobacter subterraneus DSM 17957]
MEIREAVELIWNNRKYITDDAKKAISHLNEEVAESLKALMKGDESEAKRELEDALSCLFIALKVMNVDIEEAIYHQIDQMQKKNDKVMIIKKDKVEIFYNGILKGGWSIWSEEDLKEAEKLAKEFGCEIIRELP